MSAMRSVPVVDALLAATATVHDLVLVTLGVRVLNPFESASS